MPFRVPVPARNRGDEEREDRNDDQAELRQQRTQVEALAGVAAGNHRKTEHEQDVRDDTAGDRAAHDVGQPVGDREQRNDQLGRVAKARVQEPADPRAGVLARVVGGFADQPGERDECERGKDEEGHVAEVEDVARNERERGEHQRPPEELPRHRASLAVVLHAVLFDWGDTLMRWEWDGTLLEDGHRRASTRSAAPTSRPTDASPAGSASCTSRSSRRPGRSRRSNTRHWCGTSSPISGSTRPSAELDAYLEAEHTAWSAARQLGATTHALLESLRSRGLKLAIVSNALDPGPLLHRDLADTGVAERIDFAVFSSELGVRKPHAAIFERALTALGGRGRRTRCSSATASTRTSGAPSEVGMTTVQALWFRADEHPDGGEPDYQAFTQFDVLNIVDRLRA